MKTSQFTADPKFHSRVRSRQDERDLLICRLLTHEAQALCCKGLCPPASASPFKSRLLDVYQSKVVEGALRISHYGRLFLLFAAGSFSRSRDEPQTFSNALEAVY